MNTKIFAPLLAPVILLLTLSLLPDASHLTFVDSPPVNLSLPASIAQWNLVKVLFCQNDQCLKSIEYAEQAPTTCTACGGALDTIPLGEKLGLPSDTLVVHGRYRNAANDRLDVAMVVSGTSRSSIHKPEMCLAGQGYRIAERSMLPTNLQGSNSVSLQLFDIEKSLSTTSSGNFTTRALFAYWFIGPKVKTASPLLRTWHMSKERILEGKAYRWAYVSLLTLYDENRMASVETISDFAQELQIALIPISIK